jgi:succinoglycan biosynthesis transport protein ExoP
VLRHDVETSRQLYDTLQVKLQVAGVTAGLNSSYVNIVDPAEVSSAPVAPRVRSNLALGLFGGLLSGLLLGFLVESFDETVSTSAELESVTALPVLCSIPTSALPGAAKGSSGAMEMARGALPSLLSQPRSQASEAYRGLRTSILLSTPQVQPKVIAVVSSIATEGKTTVTANLGISFAQRGEMVLLVDGDLRRSSLHAQFGMPAASQGLSTFLTQSARHAPVSKPLESLPKLHVLPAGPNPAELLGSQRMAEALELLQADYDRIIIDTPPLLSVSDALPVAHFADAAVLVVRSGVARRKAVLRVRDLLQRSNANLVGVVFNCVNLHLENYYGLPGTKYGKAMNSYSRSSEGESD